MEEMIFSARIERAGGTTSDMDSGHASGRAAISLDRVAPMAEPFRHVRIMNPLPAYLADDLLSWLDRAAPWRRHVSSFFDQFECDLCRSSLPAGLAALIAPATLRAVRADMERLFQVRLGDVYSVVAHRLVGGQGIGIHTDEPSGGRETHRLIIQLGGLPSDDSGGQLQLFSAAGGHHLHAGLPPIHNTAIALELSPRSYHAVTDLRAGVRYTLVYSFWRTDLEPVADAPGVRLGRRRPALAAPVPLAPHARHGHDLEALLDLLAPAHRLAQKPLLAHLVHTYEILRRWQCPAHVCLAGLFHSAYGIDMFPAATIPLQARQSVVKAIGARAENLAWLSGAARRSSLARAWAEHQPEDLDRRCQLRGQRGESFYIDIDTLADLACIDAARTVEQLPRIERDDAGATAAEHVMVLMPWLPHAARLELARACSMLMVAPGSAHFEAGHA